MATQRGDPNLSPPLSSIRRVTSTSLAELLDLSPDALVIVDRVGTILLANGQAEALFGYPDQGLTGQQLELLLPERLHEIHTTHREHFFSAPRTRSMGIGLNLVGRRQDGAEFPIDISLRPVLLDDLLLAIGAVRDVSEQRRAEREHMQQAERLRLQAELIDLAHDAIFTRDLAGRLAFWNKGAEELYGWTQEEALGRISHRLLHTRFPVSLSAIEAQVVQEGRWEGELVHTCRHGVVVIVESRWSLVRDAAGEPTAMLEVNRDITRRRQLEQQVQASHTETVARLEFLQLMLDALPSSVYLVYGSQARLLLANRAALGLWGAAWRSDQPLEEFLTTNGIRVFTAQGRPLALEEFATLHAVQRGETVLQQQETIRRPDGSLVPVLVNAVALGLTTQWAVLRGESEAQAPHTPSPHAEPVALAIHQDVSVLKEAEYLKDEFIGVAAHELRNPLAALRGFTTMLVYQTARGRGPALATWQQEALQEIEQATARLEKLTEDLLDVTRLQAGRLALVRKPTDLVAVTRQMLVQAHMTTQRHTFSLQTPLSALMVEVDHVRIEQVLSNVLGNAVKYSPQGGLIEVTLREEVEPHAAFLAIRDQGIGIPVDQQARIFGRFVRAENAQALEIAGTGLGLSLSRELVDLHGGHLWFESTEGGGTTFFLTLPIT